ncbi:hypothetical protein SCHPADRAFT_372631 [Schizopora paradoxa]|uniref:AB hydrolase-1 domain-containing protein n=1 Tax=Schizopora paradoxa TaxID=27342 RepID=A0A0H2RUY3_9AGAM|nr:hypothetical protein SCHPADRAFT_372631 [Schizopora paradoxa]
MHQSPFTFDDSGAPVSVLDYTTLVVLHGCAFNKNPTDTFQKLLPLAAQNKLRIVLLNRREYSDTKPFTEEEISLFDSPDDQTHELFFDARAQELAEFLADFATKENLPKACANRGGLAVMGWSAGNAYALSLLSHASAIKDATREQLEPFMRTMVIFDTPGYVIGRDSLLGQTFVLLDSSHTVEERARMFGYWVSSYFDHSNISSRRFEDLQLMPDPTEKTGASTSRMTEAEYQSMVNPEASLRADVPAMLYPPEQFANWTKRALFDDDFAGRYWPRLQVTAIWCERTCWTCVDGGWGLEELRKQHDGLGVRGRPLKITMMPGANHFPHWDEPEKTMAFFAAAVYDE